MSGDALARGARSATFGPAQVTQEKWDAVWSDDGGNTEEPKNEENRSDKNTSKTE